MRLRVRVKVGVGAKVGIRVTDLHALELLGGQLEGRVVALVKVRG